MNKKTLYGHGETLSGHNEEMHELEARINALNGALNRTQQAAVLHIEAVLGALISAQSAQQYGKFEAAVGDMEKHVNPDALSEVRLPGEKDKDGNKIAKSQRQVWHEEKNAIEAKLAEIAAESLLNIFPTA